MASRTILAFVLAGGEGTRLLPLTALQAKPALTVANDVRLIDFVLSNLINSGVDHIYVIAQYQPQTLIAHIDTTWSRPGGRQDASVKVILPESEPFKGTADAVFQNLSLVRRHRPDLVAVFAADHVYRMDVRQMADFHVERDADVTVAAVTVAIEQASSFGTLVTGPNDAIREFQEKPRCPTPITADPMRAYVSMGNYMFEPRMLERTLTEASMRNETDFGRDVFPRLQGGARFFAYDFATNIVPGVATRDEWAYWRDVGTLDALAEARADILGACPKFNLQSREWPIRRTDSGTVRGGAPRLGKPVY